MTTSKFTKEAIESSKLNKKLILVDMDQLVEWHVNAGLKI